LIQQAKFIRDSPCPCAFSPAGLAPEFHAAANSAISADLRLHVGATSISRVPRATAFLPLVNSWQVRCLFPRKVSAHGTDLTNPRADRASEALPVGFAAGDQRRNGGIVTIDRRVRAHILP
jgi:hypothetical protein